MSNKETDTNNKIITDNNSNMDNENKKTDTNVPKKSFISRFDLLNRFKHWYMGGISITRSLFRVRAAWQGVIIISSILAILFILSAFYTGAGEFVISLSSEMSEDGFFLSNTEDFSERQVCIRGTAVVADNVSIFDISEDVGYVDGMHNGQNYVAHTFYLTNKTGKTTDYRYTLNIRQSANNADKALWVMLYMNGKQTIYALEGANGEAESQYSIYNFPFESDALSDKQYITVDGIESGISPEEISNALSINTANKLVTTPFVSEKVICTDIRKEIENDEIDKFTVVMWYEGEDPECTDEIIGGWVETYMTFDYVE
ncbi:MAG: hypothetical protein IJC76_03990 [Lachnospiraceae bacterium]|nr:hypothetical protein [Lachnospiraceae bacterium]